MAKKEKEKPTNTRKPVSSTDANLLIKYANVWLVLAAILVYAKTFWLNGLTHLDDTIFIFDKQEFNKHFSNIIHAFNVGCFNEKDIYYRPLFLVTFILENPFFHDSFTIYHFTNLLLHCIDVVLLFTLLKRLNMAKHIAFVFTLVYAVHPVLTMAVAWIPGRNDLLLAAFTFSFFLAVIRYSEKPGVSTYLIQLLFIVLALFTKETAVFIPFVTMLLFFCWKKDNLFQPKYFALAGGWAAALLLWFFKRQAALSDSSSGFPVNGVISNFGPRIPGLLQYLGKTLFPFNLSVFPSIPETTFIHGFVALAVLVAIVALNKERDNKIVLLGAGWFIFFILPFFFVPKNINDQLFEHRLYIPIVGIFILLSQSILFTKKITVNTILLGGTIVSLAFAMLTFIYINKFDNELVFWSNAVASSPHSAYANKMYAIKLAENKKTDEAIPYFKTAYALDSSERYTNLFLARLIYIPKDSIVAAERSLKNEVRLNPTFPDTYFELAHVYFMKQDLPDAKIALLRFIKDRPADQTANNNLLRLLIDLKQFPEAKQQVAHMESVDLAVDAGTKAQIDTALKN